ncbi:MAG: thioredoxin family protein [Streptococcaceae bacterium]|jgi:thiol-disulfide isomerase/thioredoxin|nr:thioredoxin family protein [Streptococcaceae bacterium]
MIRPNSYEEIAALIEEGQSVFFFTASWCGDCRFIKPRLPELEAEFSELRFVEIDRDQFIDLAVKWDIYGIPSFVIIRDGKELGRLVNKERKTKEEVSRFIKGVIQ